TRLLWYGRILYSYNWRNTIYLLPQYPGKTRMFSPSFNYLRNSFGASGLWAHGFSTAENRRADEVKAFEVIRAMFFFIRSSSLALELLLRIELKMLIQGQTSE
ncbi:hypothetical protein AMQ83_27140, partial [Paenibacillus riograndensis]